ncbi:metal activated pyridoxal enzyme [Pseudidiomarina tainanensis]|uniref:Metal activated pyridoxal enzyme n=1 Tax=Pseudidiomarina tainanensis TaxID=502365 RepID=A0ACD2HI51_9GAMM|nr:alanine racemase [Pseudidiomarina tainanensis]RZQ55912.1 metal activated pyridoxal enzyme [Pseudidiomarina tainanensis]
MTDVVPWLETEQTPFLLIDQQRFLRNAERLQQRISALECQLRPHLKTLRSIDAAGYLLPDLSSPATVSTLAEAEAFADAGYSNLLYAVGISANKLSRVRALLERGVQLHILLDSITQAEAVVDYGRNHGVSFSVFIEIDCDDHRGGLPPHSALIGRIAQLLHDNGMIVTGVMSHSGGSYSATTTAEIAQAAAQECAAIRLAAEQIHELGIDCPILSVGSTPTAHFAEDLSNITEVRAGVYTTFDLVMYNLGVCTLSDIAMSVVTTIIGHNAEKNWVLVDAGWMALSRDRGTASQNQDFGYGLVCDSNGVPLDNVCVTKVNQEHGVIALPDSRTVQDFPIGTQLRVLPNHACATAAMHQHYVVETTQHQREIWPRILGW